MFPTIRVFIDIYSEHIGADVLHSGKLWVAWIWKGEALPWHIKHISNIFPVCTFNVEPVPKKTTPFQLE